MSINKSSLTEINFTKYINTINPIHDCYTLFLKRNEENRLEFFKELHNPRTSQKTTLITLQGMYSLFKLILKVRKQLLDG